MTRTHFSEVPMTDSQRRIMQRGIDSTQRALQDQADGLGYCENCHHEYTDAQVESFDPELLNADIIDRCPKCHQEDNRILYWCNQDPTEPLHAPSDCERFHHER